MFEERSPGAIVFLCGVCAVVVFMAVFLYVALIKPMVRGFIADGCEEVYEQVQLVQTDFDYGLFDLDKNELVLFQSGQGGEAVSVANIAFPTALERVPFSIKENGIRWVHSGIVFVEKKRADGGWQRAYYVSHTPDFAWLSTVHMHRLQENVYEISVAAAEAVEYDEVMRNN